MSEKTYFDWMLFMPQSIKANKFRRRDTEGNADIAIEMDSAQMWADVMKIYCKQDSAVTATVLQSFL